MLYESDVVSLLSQWQDRLNEHNREQPYRDALSDCIYELNCLMDKNFAEEALAQESYDEQLMRKGNWDEWFDSLLVEAEGMPYEMPA